MSRWHQCRNCGACLTKQQAQPPHIAMPGQHRLRCPHCQHEGIGWSVALWGMASVGGYLALAVITGQLWGLSHAVLAIPVLLTLWRGWTAIRCPHN